MHIEQQKQADMVMKISLLSPKYIKIITNCAKENEILMITTLQQDLAAFKGEFMAKLPKDKADIMARADADLAATSILAMALKAGDKAPDFTLPAACGLKVSLYETLKNGPAIIVFYRGGWCPYCNLELRTYQRLLPEIRKSGAQLMAISPQNPDGSLTTQEKNALAYPVLSDTGNQAAKAFGILFDLPAYLSNLYAGFGNDLTKINAAGTWQLPLPATFVIGQDGVIIKAFVETDYRERMEPAKALAAIKVKQAA
jgi:peroxiredoxin